MRRLVWSLKGHFSGVLLIIAMLALQVSCDLCFPAYTADIIDIGIGQSGIETPLVPELSETGMRHLLLLMTQEEQETALSAYEKDGEVYRKRKLEKEDEQELEKVMTAPMVAVYALSTDGADYEEVLGDLYVPRGMDVFGILEVLPDETRLGLTEAAREQIKRIPQNLISQAAVNFAREDMRSRGIDVDALQRRYLMKKGAALILAAVLSVLFAVLAAALASRISAECAEKLRQELLERTLSSREAGSGRFSVAELVARSTGDIRQIQQMLSVFFRMVFHALLLGTGTVVGMFLLNRQFGRIALVVMLLSLILTGGGVFLALPRYRVLRTSSDRLARTVRENVQGMMTMRVFGTQKREKERLEKESGDLMKAVIRSGRLTSLALPLLMLLMDAAVLLAAWKGASGINEGSLLSGGLMAGIQYLMMEVSAFVTLAAFLASMPAGVSAAARVQEAADAGKTMSGRRNEVDVEEPMSGRRGETDELRTTGDRKNETDAGIRSGREAGAHKEMFRAPALELRDVAFCYPGQSMPAVHDISFTVDYGEKVALVGGTGSGKTTLLRMISSVCAPTEGEIRIDGKTVGRDEPRPGRGKIGYVPQEAFLFSGTVASNLRLGKSEASEEEMWAALAIAQAETFVRESGKGLDMEIAPGGANLSGGQRQRVTIARALTGAPEICLFDDCFSALDAETDARLQAALAEAVKDAAVLVADQQIRRIMDADRIIVLDGGRIAGIGRHEELMRSCEVYRQIALSQEPQGAAEERTAGENCREIRWEAGTARRMKAEAEGDKDE